MLWRPVPKGGQLRTLMLKRLRMLRHGLRDSRGDGAALWQEVLRRQLSLTPRALVWARLGVSPQGFDAARASDQELRDMLEMIAREFDAEIAAVEGIEELQRSLREGWSLTRGRIALSKDLVVCEVSKGDDSRTLRLSGPRATLAGQLLVQGLPLPGDSASGLDQPHLVLCIGSSDLSAGVLGKISLWEEEEGLPAASVRISRPFLSGLTVDYAAPVRALAVSGNVEQPIFTGLVGQVTHDDEETEIELHSLGAPLTEMGIGGLGIGAGVEVLEAIWSMMRTSGVPEDRIDIGFHGGPLETFEVTVPLEAIELDDELTVGEVILSPAIRRGTLPRRLGPRELRREFTNCDAWALVRVEQHTLLDAELDGAARIAATLAWLTANARYSFNKTPEGQLVDFDRAWTRTRLQARDVLYVRGLSTGRAWLRSPTGVLYVPVASSESVGRFSPGSDFGGMSDQFRESLNAWHRAATEADPVAAVAALWEAVEFYVAGVRGEKLFPKDLLASIRERATEGLTPEQTKRVENRIGELNSPSLMEKFRLALDREDVPILAGELEVLRRVRKARNDFQHGRSGTPPTEEDIRQALALVNRALIYNAGRASVPPDTRGSR